MNKAMWLRDRTNRVVMMVLVSWSPVALLAPAGCGTPAGDLLAELGFLMVDSQIHGVYQQAVVDSVGTRNAVALFLLDTVVEAGIQRNALDLLRDLFSGLENVESARLRDELEDTVKGLDERLKTFGDESNLTLRQRVNDLKLGVEEATASLLEGRADSAVGLDPSAEVAAAVGVPVEDFTERLDLRVSETGDELESILQAHRDRVRYGAEVLADELATRLDGIRQAFAGQFVEGAEPDQAEVEAILDEIDAVLAAAVQRFGGEVDDLTDRVEVAVAAEIDASQGKLSEEVEVLHGRIGSLTEPMEAGLTGNLENGLRGVDQILTALAAEVQGLVEGSRMELEGVRIEIVAEAGAGLDELVTGRWGSE